MSRYLAPPGSCGQEKRPCQRDGRPVRSTSGGTAAPYLVHAADLVTRSGCAPARCDPHHRRPPPGPGRYLSPPVVCGDHWGRWAPAGRPLGLWVCPQGPFAASGRALYPLNEWVNDQTTVCRVATLFIVHTLLDNQEGLACISPEHGPLGFASPK